MPGIIAGLILQHYTVCADVNSLYKAVEVKKLLQNGTIVIDDAVHIITGIYGCNDQEKMSLAYSDIIAEETCNILSGIQNGNFSTSDKLSDVIAKFSRGKKKPMTSLRDTEEQIEIEI